MFLVFAGDTYYPRGGWQDFKGYAISLDSALEMVANLSCDWWHIAGPSSEGSTTIIKKGGRD